MPDDPLDLAPQMVPFVTGSELERQYQGTIPHAPRPSESPADRERQSGRPAIDPRSEERAQPHTAKPEFHKLAWSMLQDPTHYQPTDFQMAIINNPSRPIIQGKPRR